MRKCILLQALVLTLMALPVRAQEFRVGLGAFVLTEDGVDLQLSYRPKDSRWLYGYRYVNWTYTFDDPFTGRTLTRSTDTKSGPIVDYLFRPESPDTWFLSLAWLNWSRKERVLMTGETNTNSTSSPYFGGGYMASLGKSFYWNIGVLLSPGAKLNTQTSVSSENSSGGFDLQFQLGVRF